MDHNEIVTARLFKAPPDDVFDAFADPFQLARWWGPSGCTNEFLEFDLRPGGAWRFVMRGPDGSSYAMVNAFVEVAPDRVVFLHLEPGHRFTMTMTFQPRTDGTSLEWRMQFESPEEVARYGEVIRAANEQNFDRLERWLSERRCADLPR